MPSTAVLEPAGQAPARSRNVTALVLLGTLLAAGGSVVGLNMAREKSRWLSLVDSCPRLDPATAQQLGVTPAPATLQSRQNIRRICTWSGPAGALRTTVTRYDGTLLTDPEDAAVEGVAGTRLIGFHPLGPQTRSTTFGDWRPQKNSTALLTATGNVVLMVEHNGAGTAEGLRAPLQTVISTLVTQLG